MSGDHAALAASKSATWVNCHGALALAKHLGIKDDDRKSEDAAAGTCTHSIAHRMLMGEPVPAAGTTEMHDGFAIKVDDDRLERAREYVDKIQAMGGAQFYEVRLDSTPVFEVPDQFCTADAVVADVQAHALHVRDLKDGNGIVPAQDNEQLLIYLLVAWHEFGYIDEFQKFSAGIEQPRKKWYPVAEYTREQLLEWQDKIRRAAKHAVELLDPKTPLNVIMASLVPGEKQCKWCPARGRCAAQAGLITSELPDTTRAGAALSFEEMGAWLKKRVEIESWFDSLYGAALAAAISGTNIPGMKLVTGREGNRAWPKDPKQLEEIGEAIYECIQGDAYTRELISPAVAQKKLCKKKSPPEHIEVWGKVSALVTRSAGAPALVPEADGRPQVSIEGPEFESVDNANDLTGGL